MKLKYLLTILLFLPLILMGQIPKDHFLDADDTAENGYKIKPFIQKAEGIYHYAVLTELPFENNCKEYPNENEQINCSENTLKVLIGQQIRKSTDYNGVANIYLTVNRNSDINDIKIITDPKSVEIEGILKAATENITTIPAKYKGRTVTARLWTEIDFKKRN